ncbi:MAG: formylglycine-generating enzyme family protein [Thermodesulfobacteriota bacterium]|nr:formylglycine-generating enzyme family protein [Thermodesulfobacteriota bacterium]
MKKLFTGLITIAVITTTMILCPVLQKKAIADQVFTNRLGMRFILIPQGRFPMGSPDSEKGREWHEKRHIVTISKKFYIQETEVTQGQWEKLVGFNPSAFPDCGKNCPVDTVSWNQCMEFIRVLNKWEKTDKYRLPTEAEWEYACRAGTTTAFAGGPITHLLCKPMDHVLNKLGWFCGNSGYKKPPDVLRPHPVKTKRPNRWGIYDMHGNVQEWCLDSCKWRDFWKGKVGVITNTYKNNIVDPLSKTGNHKIFRGGGWHQSARYCRSAYRSYYKPVAKRNSLGFRIVREY